MVSLLNHKAAKTASAPETETPGAGSTCAISVRVYSRITKKNGSPRHILPPNCQELWRSGWFERPNPCR